MSHRSSRKSLKDHIVRAGRFSDSNEFPSINYLWSALVVEELVRLGIKYLCIGPGSRSTPLTIAAAENANITTIVHFDERSLAFYALGLAKGSGEPVGVLTTSGTAVANLLPAIVEAKQDSVPLVIMSADRPIELLDCGANQAIDQSHIFRSFVTHFQMNDDTLRPMTSYSGSEPGKPSHSIAMEVLQQASRFSKEEILIIAGNVKGEADAAGILAVEMFSDGDATALRIAQNPDAMVVMFGDRFVSKSLLTALGKSRPFLVQISDTASRQDPNHAVNVRLVADIAKTCNMLMEYPLLSKRGGGGTSTSTSSEDKVDDDNNNKYSEDKKSSAGLAPLSSGNSNTMMMENAAKDEATFVKWVCEQLGADHALFVGNSMAIRYVDRHASRLSPTSSSSSTSSSPSSRNSNKAAPSIIYANRGASGIDGVVSTALGVQQSTEKHVVLIIGDLSFLHDIGSLSLAKDHHITIVLLNNNGGIIFQKLPVYEQKHIFREYFQAPHGLESFKCTAKQFGISYTKIDGHEEMLALQQRLQSSEGSKTPALFELIIHEDEEGKQK
eukprot:jgi/Bigna1/140303/aug1.55_g15011